MTHWIRGALGRVMNRLAQRVQTTERGGPSRKIKGVSTVEYALIMVAVVGIAGAGIAMFSDEFKNLFDQVEAEMTGTLDKAKDVDDNIS